MKISLFYHRCLCRIMVLAILLLSYIYPCSVQSQVVATPASIPPTPTTATAVSGSVVTQTAKGLNVTVDSRWLDGQGYRPLRISITPNAAVTADRELMISASINQQFWNPNLRYIWCEQFITIPAGTNAGQPITATISMPPAPTSSDYSIEVTDPALVKGNIFQQPQLTGMTNRYYLPGYDVLPKYPRILFIGNAVPDTSAILACMPQSAQYQNAYQAAGNVPSPAPVNQNNLALPSATSLSMSDLPVRWIDYSSLDVVCLSIDQLTALAQKHSAAHRALLQWTESGGNLWIYGFSGNKWRWDRIDDTEQLLDLLNLPADNDITNWIKPTKDSFGKHGQYDSEPSNPAVVDQPVLEIGKQIENNLNPSVSTTKAPPAPNEPSFLIREYGMGTVAAIASDDPYSGDAKWSKWEWDWLISTTGTDRLTWSFRHGLEIGQPNSEFWNFLIPGIGLAPVKTFQVLITLFVIGIGPANYWLLWRRKKLHLIVLTVPVSALLVTVALFSYALFADGLGTRVRVRSVTRLDQRRGTAVSWARISYYAGLAPSSGLTFSENVAVYPILGESELSYRNRNSVRKKMLWENDQRLVQGWLNSRTPTQYLAIRTAATKNGLKITAPSDSSNPLEIENQLGVFVQRLAIRDRNNKYYLIDKLNAGAKAQVKETSPEQITTWLRTAIMDNRPQNPPGLDQGTLNLSRNRYYYGPNNSPESNFSMSQMEQTMEYMAGNTSIREGAIQSLKSDGEPLAPGSYVALTSKLPPEIELGTDSAKEEASFHVIIGEW